MKYSFCPICGGAIEPHELHDGIIDAYRCVSCGDLFWQNSSPGVGALIINHKNELLLTRRAIEPKKGEWDLPGGFLKNGEDPLLGLRREIREELGLDIAIGPLIEVVVDQYGPEGPYTLNLFYQASPLGGEVITGDDVDQYSWFHLDRLPREIAFASIRHVISRYRES